MQNKTGKFCAPKPSQSFDGNMFSSRDPVSNNQALDDLILPDCPLNHCKKSDDAQQKLKKPTPHASTCISPSNFYKKTSYEHLSLKKMETDHVLRPRIFKKTSGNLNPVHQERKDRPKINSELKIINYGPVNLICKSKSRSKDILRMSKISLEFEDLLQSITPPQRYYDSKKDRQNSIPENKSLMNFSHYVQKQKLKQELSVANNKDNWMVYCYFIVIMILMIGLGLQSSHFL